jgi:hypothetical protein
MCGFDSCVEFCPFLLFIHNSLFSCAQVLCTIRRNFRFLYLNSSVNTSGQADITMSCSDRWYYFKEYFTQSIAITDKYLFTTFLNMF